MKTEFELFMLSDTPALLRTYTHQQQCLAYVTSVLLSDT